MKDNLKLSVSNIAWEPDSDFKVAEFLRKTNISRVEIALTRYHNDISKMSASDASRIKRHWAQFDIEISSLQSLFFNKPELQLFGDSNSRSAMKDLLDRIYKLALLLDAKALVFGAPKNRIRGELDLTHALTSAADFFRELDANWSSSEVFLALESNPEFYGCDFLTRSSDALDFVKALGVKSLRWHLDTACTELGGESVLDLLLNQQVLPSHIHLSEPSLGPLLPSKFGYYREIFTVLQERDYSGFIVLEMRETGDTKQLFESISLMRDACNI